MNSFIFILHFFLSFNNTGRCVCLPVSVETNFKTSKVIFSGKVLSVDTVKLHEEGLPKLAFKLGYLAKIKIQKVYKGKLKGDSISVLTGEGYADCGYDFSLMKNYIVYANADIYILIDSMNTKTLELYKTPKHFFTTTICDRTTQDVVKEGKLLRQYLQKHSR